MAAFSLKRAIGPDALNKLKTCEFHFKECRNRQARKLNERERRNFKDLCNALLEAVSPTAYEKSKEDLENFVAESEERKYLQSWIKWWHKRRNYIFRAFVQFESAPKSNHAELIHASWVKRDKMDDGTGKVEQAHLFKKNEIKLQEIRSVGLNGSERT